MNPREIEIFDNLVLNNGYAFFDAPNKTLYALNPDLSGMFAFPVDIENPTAEELNQLIQDSLQTLS